MSRKQVAVAAALICAALSVILISSTTVPAQRALPNPVLYLTGQEPKTLSGKQVIRYHFAIFNADSYPAELFAQSPDLPPCGSNTRASRTWIDVYDQQGKRLNGFCAITDARGLSDIWFSLDAVTIAPSWIYIEFTDRKTGTKYKSNLAETTL